MKNSLFSLLFVIGIFSATAQVGINNTTPDASSALDITSTDGGILIPRMTLAERDLIPSPATGLMIFQTDNTPGFYYFEGTWKPFTGDDNWVLSADNIYNANTGNVGVGTSTPTAKLHVEAVTSGPPTVILTHGFETAGTSVSPFTTLESGAKGWRTWALNPHTGTKAAMAGQLATGDKSTLLYQATIPAGGATISFYYKVSTGSAQNKLTFNIDGIEQGSWSGEMGYTQFTATLPSGPHTLKWEYYKAFGASGAEPAPAFIDDVLIETAVQGALRIVDGSEGLGKVLISDATGNASWQELNNEIIVDIPLIAAFGGMKIPACNSVAPNSTGSFVILIKGVSTTVTWEILLRQTSQGSVSNAVTTVNLTSGPPNTITTTTTPVLAAIQNPERLQVKYDFSPPLPFPPNGLIFSANNASKYPDTFTLNYAEKSASSITMNITRNDKFGDTTSDCWQGEFFFDVFMTN